MTDRHKPKTALKLPIPKIDFFFSQKDVYEKGAVYLSAKHTIIYEYLRNKSHGLPSTMYSSETIAQYLLAFKVKPHLPWVRDTLDPFLTRFREMGIIQRLLVAPLPLEATQLQTRQADGESTRLAPMNLTQMLTPLMFLVAGWAITLLMFGAEMYWAGWRSN